MRVVVEICVEGAEAAVGAQEGGADRVELCENLAVGGVTPGAGAIAVACRALTIPVHVLVRPRGGDFCYGGIEFAVMRQDVETAKALGASGVVLGILTPDGAVDLGRVTALVAAARPLSVRFHKAFDAVRDPFVALEELVALDVDRVLTSGGAPTAREGLGRLADLMHRAADRITVMAGGAVTEGDVPPILGAGIREVHVGSSVCAGNKTDPEKVRRLVEVVRSRSR